ncbi:helix-turn-helix domain-containing protein [Jiella avicenniae]|uniref:Type II toxin-antitoxin system MqsA family antitoxin n=1 Tax=Jiella avicenniae TaxID=2907202 RepID=A0A9X1TAL0_9HYPH|nr:type II toxin-antitoxin system MqsA family antitoxin [Jiella avicenniae]MCE7027253.1 type II toxin-antitoxin system MqsA family antitoxin [Jiella avicenniae]
MSRVGDDLVEAFAEIEAELGGTAKAQSYDVPAALFTPERIRSIRSRLAVTTRAFEREFAIPARRMDAYEQGRRRPDETTIALLRVIEKDPDAVRKALASEPLAERA